MHGAGPQITARDAAARHPGRVRRRAAAHDRAPRSTSCASRWPRSTPTLCAALGDARGAGVRRPRRPARRAGAAARPGRRPAAVPAASRSSTRSPRACVPVVAPLAVGPLNVNADDAAAALALGLGARSARLPHRRARPLRRRRGRRAIGAGEANRHARRGRFDGGIVPKLRAAALAAGNGIAAHDRPDGGRSHDAAATLEPTLLPTYARLGVTFVEGDGSWLVDDDGRRYLDLFAGHRSRRARPPPSRAARGSARAARPAVARLEPLLDRADAGARRAAVRPVRRRQRVLLQLGRRVDRGRAQVGAQGDRPHRGRRARGLVPRPHVRRAVRHRAAREARGVRAARAGRRASRRRRRSPSTSAPRRPRSCSSPCRARAASIRSRPRCSKQARALADEHGALLILDEVQTGVGRSGRVLRLAAATACGPTR